MYKQNTTNIKDRRLYDETRQHLTDGYKNRIIILVIIHLTCRRSGIYFKILNASLKNEKHMHRVETSYKTIHDRKTRYTDKTSINSQVHL